MSKSHPWTAPVLAEKHLCASKLSLLLHNVEIEFQENSAELTLRLDGVNYSLSDVQKINFDFETFENITLFVNSENSVMNTAGNPYYSVTNFGVHNNGTVLIP